MIEDDNGVAANAVSKQKINGFVAEVEECKDRKASLQGTYMAECKVINEEIKEIKGRAKDAGVNRKVFNRILEEERDLDRKKASLVEGLDEDQIDQFDDLRMKLGMLADTPLGNYAETANEKRKARKSAAADSLVN